MGQELVGVDLHLVLFDEPADAGHLGDAGHRRQFVAQVPVLEAPELLEVQLAAGILEDVLVDPTHAGGIRAQAGG